MSPKTPEEIKQMAQYCGEERRKAHEEWIHKIEDLVDKVSDKIDALVNRLSTAENFQGQARIAYVILMAIFIASFIYTYNHKQDSKAEFDKFHREINAHTLALGELKGRQLLIEDRYTRLLRDIEKLTDNLSDYVQAHQANSKVQRVEIENYKTEADNLRSAYPIP